MGLFVEERAKLLGSYIAENGATVRQAARYFAVSKSTVHVDVTRRLRSADRDLFERVRAVLEENKRERHLRGGIATKEKYRAVRGETAGDAQQDEEAATFRLSSSISEKPSSVKASR